jgi:hemerythrin-like metal-binding protein
MPVATETFHWTETYSVNIAVLDEQHRRLFDTVNELHRALQAGEGAAALKRVLQKLTNYATEHFAAEKALMAQYNFPGLSIHRHHHDEFRDKLAEFIDAHSAGKAGAPVAVLLFLQDWLKDHLLKTDKQYSGFLNARGVH